MKQVICVVIWFILEKTFSANLLFFSDYLYITQVADSFERLSKHLVDESADRTHLKFLFLKQWVYY